MSGTVEELISEVRAAREQLLAHVRPLTSEEGIWKPESGEWSVAEIVEHLVLAEQVGINRIWQAAEAVQAGAAPDDSTNHGLSIEEVIARTWKPRETAPPEATPVGGGLLAYWIACFESCQTVLDALGRRLDGMDLGAVVFPHFLCGPLDARQRLQFLRFHIERHGEQIKERKSQIKGP